MKTDKQVRLHYAEMINNTKQIKIKYIRNKQAGGRRLIKALKVIHIKGSFIRKMTAILSLFAILLIFSVLSHDGSTAVDMIESTSGYVPESTAGNASQNSAGDMEGAAAVQIENKFLQLEYDPGQNTFRIENRSNGRVYRTEPSGSYQTIRVRKLSGTGLAITLKYNSDYGELALVSEITLENQRIKGVMKAAADAALPKPAPFPGAFYGEEREQFFAIPYAEGIYVPANKEYAFGEYKMWGHKSTMPFTGMTNSETGIMITSETPADTAVSFVKAVYFNTENYLMQLVHYPVKGRFEYDRVFYIDIIENDGYNEMAKKFRTYLENRQKGKRAGEPDVLITLKDKLLKNKNVNKLIGAVDFWLGPQNMKSTVIINDLAANGVKKAVLNFPYGWIVYEDEKSPRVVEYAAEQGLISSRYDNYSDIYEENAKTISPRYRTDGVNERSIIMENGSFQRGFTSYCKGQPVQGYRLNTGFSVRDVDSYLKKDLKENKYLGRFVDVAVSCELYEDYSDSHPMLRKEDMLKRYNLLEKISSQYGMITGTEDTAWWSVPVSHYSEGTMTIVTAEGAGGDWSTPVDDPGKLYVEYTVNPSVRIPLKSLVYHDCHISGWYTGDGLSKAMEYWKTKELLTVLYGAMSLVYPCDDAFWAEYRDQFLRSIKVTGWVFEKVGYAKMERHEFVTSDGMVQKTQFSNETEIVVNFSHTAFCYGKATIPAEDFLLISGKKVYSSAEIAALH